jgi:hypothetical protein
METASCGLPFFFGYEQPTHAQKKRAHRPVFMAITLALPVR